MAKQKQLIPPPEKGHTPGPWVVERRLVNVAKDGRHITAPMVYQAPMVYHDTPSGTHICVCNGTGNNDANAALIALVPHMVHALKLAQIYLTVGNPDEALDVINRYLAPVNETEML